MLTLNADSACDVCAEEYGPFNLPRCIPCGHVLCATCADTIIDKASSSSSHVPQEQHQQSPLCPFCRESFTREGVRVIRIDFSGSSGGGVASSSGTGLNGGGNGNGRGMGDTETCIDGGAFAPSQGMSMSMTGTLDDEMVLFDPRSRSPPSSSRTSRDPSRATSPERTGPNRLFHAINEDHSSPLPLPANFDVNAHRERARELEKKVAKVACKRCSAEEVQALQRELGDWLSIDKILGSNGVAALDKQQRAAIHLSHLLIRAILMNHLAHSEASRVAKGAEAQLRARIADGELVREKLDADLRKAKKELAARMQENMTLRAELARLKGPGSNEDPTAQGHGGGEFRAVTPTRRQSLSAPTSPDGYFPSFAFSPTSSASTAVPPPSASRSNPTSGTNSPCSSGRTTPTAGLALGGGSGMGMGMMPMGSQVSIGMTLSSAGISPSPSMNGANVSERTFMGTSGGMSSASASAAAANSVSTSTSSASAAAAAAAAAGHRTFTISAPPPRAQSTVPSSRGVSSASSAATTTATRPQATVPPRSQTPASPTRYGGHTRSASMIHRSATVVPGLSSSSSSASASAASQTHGRSHSTSTSTTTGRDRRLMTPAPPSLPHPGTGGPGPASSSPMHQRSASVAPGVMSSASSAAAGRGLARSMTPNLRSSNTNRERDNKEKEGMGMGMGNGYSAGVTNANTNGYYGFSSASGHGIPPVPALPLLSSLGIPSPSSRPPVPPKPRTLSQSPSSQNRGVVDDRDGYATERESTKKDKDKDAKGAKDAKDGREGKKERTRRHVHERWLPSALVDRMTRPATSHG